MYFLRNLLNRIIFPCKHEYDTMWHQFLDYYDKIYENDSNPMGEEYIATKL